MDQQHVRRKNASVIPTCQKDIPYALLHKLDFNSAKSKKLKIDSAIASIALVKDVDHCTLAKIYNPCIFRLVNACSSKPAILSLIPQYAKNLVPKSTPPSFPKPLQSLHQSSFHQHNYAELLSACACTSCKNI